MTTVQTNGSVRIGYYICHCGHNIGSKVDVEAVAEAIKPLPNVEIARTHKYMCSDPGQEMIHEDIEEHNLNRIIVASCSPLLHEHTFRQALNKAGLNPYFFQMVNIRENVSWVHEDIDQATEKAIDLSRAAVRRIVHHKPLETRQVSINPDVLIVGGGIAGIHAALTMANAGKKVYLVERSPTLGGHMAQFDKTFPTLDCSACILTPKMSEVKNHPNITLWTYSEVVEFSGFVGSFKGTIKRKPRYVDEDLCVGCLDCVDSCIFKKPKFEDEFNVGLSKRNPIYIPFPQATPSVAVIDPEACIEFKTGKCKKTCVEQCERDAIDFNQQEKYEEIEVGSAILATGFQTFQPQKISNYGYGKYDNVYSSLEIERLVNSAGPTGGVLTTKDGKSPKRVGIIHCVGSRDHNTNRWCSKVCCMYSLKLAHLIKEHSGAEVYNFYIDMRTPGKGYEEFYDKLLEEGVHFIRGRVSEITETDSESGDETTLNIRAEDTLLGIMRNISVDMAVLSVGVEPRSDAGENARMFNISTSDDGFYMEKHPKLAPVDTSVDGVFVAGGCQGPKDIPESVGQAGAAASQALAMIDRGYMNLEPNTATIQQEKCSGCKTCISLCPYSALSFSDEAGHVEINEAICKGCGTCVPACPSSAIGQNLFDDQEILSEIDGLLINN